MLDNLGANRFSTIAVQRLGSLFSFSPHLPPFKSSSLSVFAKNYYDAQPAFVGTRFQEWISRSFFYCLKVAELLVPRFKTPFGGAPGTPVYAGKEYPPVGLTAPPITGRPGTEGKGTPPAPPAIGNEVTGAGANCGVFGAFVL